MKKILIILLIILLVILSYFAIFKGITLGNFEILSVEKIQAENDRLTQEIEATERLMHSNYTQKTDELKKSVDNLMTAKDEYWDLASISTDKQLKEATKEEIYKIEYIWTRIGSHATSEGVELKLDITAGETGEEDSKNLLFTVTGNYIAVINFVLSIEDDSQLGFRIENFKILPGSGENGRQATFTVRNVRIKTENASSGTMTPENSNNTNTDVNSRSSTNPDANTNTAQPTRNHYTRPSRDY